MDEFQLKKRDSGKYYRKNNCIKCERKKRKLRTAANAANRVCITEKQCSTCKTVRPVIFFHTDDEKKDGYMSQCICCKFLPKMIRDAKARNAERIKKGRKMPPVKVTPAFLKSLPPACVISGVPLMFCPGQVHMASLDRIDDKKGYTDKNVRLLDIRLNTRAKWTVTKFQESCGPDWMLLVEQGQTSLLPTAAEMDGHTLVTKLQKIADSCNDRNKKKMKKAGLTGALELITLEFIMNLWD